MTTIDADLLSDQLTAYREAHALHERAQEQLAWLGGLRRPGLSLGTSAGDARQNL
jgi:type II secretory pathway component PulK